MGYSGPPWRIDGPLPQAPPHTLLQVARIVDDLDSGGIPRWINGVQVYPYPSDLPGAWDACNHGTQTKSDGTPVGLPEFGAFTVYLGETCSSYGIWGAGLSDTEAQTRFNARVKAAFSATEAFAVEKEFMAGALMGLNPYLADGNGVINTTAVSVLQAFVTLENLIAATGKRGVIHCSPGAAVIARDHHLIPTPDVGNMNDTLYTINGNAVVPGFGYVGVSRPAGSTAPNANQEYIYATGPIEVRRSETYIMPGTVKEALDRAANTITYRAEREYVVDWDTTLQAAVRADRSLN